MRDVEQFIRSLCNPPQRELDELLAKGRPLTLGPREFFCKPGQTRHDVGFLHEGLARYHVLTERGDDVTKDFALPGRFVVSFGSAVQHQPAQVAISTVTASRFTVWPFEWLRSVLEGHVEWERFNRRIAEFLYVRKERRELDFLLRSAPERYEVARVELGPAFGELPRDMLASYLGIAPESLSRLRRRLLKKK